MIQIKTKNNQKFILATIEGDSTSRIICNRWLYTFMTSKLCNIAICSLYVLVKQILYVVGKWSKHVSEAVVHNFFIRQYGLVPVEVH